MYKYVNTYSYIKTIHCTHPYIIRNICMPYIYNPTDLSNSSNCSLVHFFALARFIAFVIIFLTIISKYSCNK